MIPATPRSTKTLQNIGTAAQHALRRVRRNAVKEREIFLQELKQRLALCASSKNPDVKAAIKTIDRQLTEGRRFRRIANAIKPTTTAALTKVEIVTTQSHLHPRTGKIVESKTVKIVNTRQALETVIIERNKKHFAQAEGTPFTRDPLSRIGSSNGYSVYHDAAGTAIQVPEDGFVERKLVMELLRDRHKSLTFHWSDVVSFNAFIAGFLHWSEQTSTSPSGCHLGLYGALVTAYCNSSGEFSDSLPDSYTTTQEEAEQILLLIHGIAASAARYGFYLRRWVQVVNVMIYKKLGCIELDRLRVIHLFEADFNLMIGILFGRRAMYHQVDNQLLNLSQFGRPGGECPNACISKILHNLTSTFTHTPMGQFESDATACFDREIMPFVLACYHSTGAPLGPLRMWEQVLSNVVHKVLKSGFGLSKDSYRYSPASPIHGPGQGSRGGPASCSTMTSVLIDGMPKLCHGLHFTDPSQELQYTATEKCSSTTPQTAPTGSWNGSTKIPA
jgi:hypothetical protein